MARMLLLSENRHCNQDNLDRNNGHDLPPTQPNHLKQAWEVLPQ
jgi:hypothetical protein